jgi:hypothetical protein
MKIACHDSLDPLFQNLGIWIQGSGAVGHVSSVTYFSNLLEDKGRRLKIELTLSMILRVNLRLGGYSIQSASLILPHIKEDNYSGYEHLTALMQSRKYSEDIFKMKFGRTRRCLQKYSDACSTRLRRARGLVRPGYTGLYTWHTFPRIGVGIWSTPYICCNYSYPSRTTPTVVKLVGYSRKL